MVKVKQDAERQHRLSGQSSGTAGQRSIEAANEAGDDDSGRGGPDQGTVGSRSIRAATAPTRVHRASETTGTGANRLGRHKATAEQAECTAGLTK